MDNLAGDTQQMRIQKYIAHTGICSRRDAEEMIEMGRVEIAGRGVATRGMKVAPHETVLIDGKPITTQLPKEDEFVYIMINKPVDVICSADNTQGMTVLDLLTKQQYAGRNKKELNARVYPVGRLDKDSEGLVLLTNDGDLTNILTHPKYNHEKEYIVTLTKKLDRESEKILQKGMTIDDGTFVQGIYIKEKKNKGRRFEIHVILTEGKNRQIRKMFGQLGYHIVSLKRVRIGKLTLGSLSTGMWKYVTKKMIV